MRGEGDSTEPTDAAAALEDLVHADIWNWLTSFVSARNSFYNGKFAPCPYARTAILQAQVDVAVYSRGNAFDYIRERSLELRDTARLSTRVMAFAPRFQWRWGMTKTMPSRHPGAEAAPYFIVVANRLDAVLAGADALKRTAFYRDWPPEQFELVVQRRERMARQYGRRGGPGDVAIPS